MQDIFRNRIFYYSLIPAILCVWVLYIALFALPNRSQQWQDKVKIYEQAQPLIKEIIILAPERIVAAKEKTGGFDYDKAIDKTARLCKISPSKVTPNIRRKMKQGKQQVQDAVISINEVGIRKFAMFLSISLHLWPDLECERLKLTRLKGHKDLWKTDVNFKYFY